MMFTEKEIMAYRNIKAPDDLRKKINQTHKKNHKVLYFISAVAACFVFIMSGIITNNQSNIVINGQKLNESIVFYDTASSYGRNVSSTISVPVEIKVLRSTKVCVSDGFISLDGNNPTKEITIFPYATIWWEIELDETDNVYEMMIFDKKGVNRVILEYENAKITVTKEKEK